MTKSINSIKSTRSLTKNFMAYATLNFFNLAFPLLITPMVYHRLGLAAMGVITFILNVVGYFALIGNMAIPNYGIREIARNKDDRQDLQQVFSELYILQVVLNLTILILYLCLIAKLVTNSRVVGVEPLLYYLFALSMLSGVLALTWVFEGLEEFRFITSRTILIKLSAGVAIFFLVHGPDDILLYAWCLLVPDLLVGIVSSGVILRKIRPQWVSPIVAWRKHGSKLIHVFMLYSAYFLMTNLDVLFLGYAADIHQVAYYGINSKIIGILYTLLLSFIYVAGPRLANYVKTNPNEYERLIKQLADLFVVPVLLLSLSLFELKDRLLYFFGGGEFLAAAPSLAVFALYFSLMALRYFLSSYVYFANGCEKLVARVFYLFIFLATLLKFLLWRDSSALLLIAITAGCELAILLTLYVDLPRVIGFKFSFCTLNNAKCLLVCLLVLLLGGYYPGNQLPLSSMYGFICQLLTIVVSFVLLLLLVGETNSRKLLVLLLRKSKLLN